MADCERLNSCSYFNSVLQNMPTIADMTRTRYCQGDNKKCARFMVFKALGKGTVPDDLMPHEVEKAKKIIEENA